MERNDIAPECRAPVLIILLFAEVGLVKEPCHVNGDLIEDTDDLIQRKVLWSGMKNLPSVIARAAVLMVATPLMFLLFIFNLIKSLIATAIGWFVFKTVSFFAIGFGLQGYVMLTRQNIPAPEWFNNLMTDFVFPHGVPIYYWWETTIIVVLAVITALSLTFRPEDEK